MRRRFSAQQKNTADASPRARWSRRAVVNGIGFLFLAGALFLTRQTPGMALSEKDTHPPRMPSGVSVSVQGSTVLLDWDEQNEQDLFTYVVEAQVMGLSAQEYLAGNTTRFQVPDLPAGRRVQVRVAAEDRAGNRSVFTPELIVRTGNTSGLRGVHAWTPIQADQEDVHETVLTQADLFDSLSPFQYDVQEDGSLKAKGEISEVIQSIQKERNLAMLPTISNVNAAPKTVSTILNDDALRSAHIAAIVEEVKARDFDGIDINYESLGAEAQEGFTRFAQELSKQLHENDKQLSITVQPKTDGLFSSSGPVGIDYAVVGEAADQVRIMLYDAARTNTGPGSVAPLPWAQERIAYALEHIPAHKIVAGIPLYGYHWCVEEDDAASEESQDADETVDQQTSTCQTTGITWDGVQQIQQEQESVESLWNEQSQTPWLRYKNANGETAEVHYENAESVQKKIEAYTRAGIQQIVFWRLGSEDPSVFDEVRNARSSEGSLAESVQITPQDGSISLTWPDFIDASNLDAMRMSYRAQGDVFTTPAERPVGERTVIIEPVKNGTPVDLFLEHARNTQNDTEASNGESTLLEEREHIEQQTPFASVIPYASAAVSPIESLRVEQIAPTFVDVTWNHVSQSPRVQTNDASQLTYDVRISAEPITDQTFWSSAAVDTSALTANGVSEASTKSMRIRGLASGQSYYLAVRYVSEDGSRYSDLSDVVQITTPDTVAPPVPQGLRGLWTDDGLLVSWSDTGRTNDLAQYLLEYRGVDEQQQEVEQQTIPATTQNVLLRIPKQENDVVLRIAAQDTSGNKSNFSESVHVTSEDVTSLLQSAWTSTGATIQAAAASLAEWMKAPSVLPYLAMLTIIVANIFLFKSMRNDLATDVVQRHTREKNRLYRQGQGPRVALDAVTQTRSRIRRTPPQIMEEEVKEEPQDDQQGAIIDLRNLDE